VHRPLVALLLVMSAVAARPFITSMSGDELEVERALAGYARYAGMQPPGLHPMRTVCLDREKIVPSEFAWPLTFGYDL
jgi:hypothetical protein